MPERHDHGKNFSGKDRIKLCAKSLISQVYDLLASQRGLEKIAREGGTRIRVILDSELKKNLHRDLARSESKGNSGDAKTEIVEQHGFRVVRGKIPASDPRIEYETSDQEHARVGLELATEHYRFRNIVQKVRAGFSIYPRSGRLKSATRPGPARTHCGDFEPMNIHENHVALLMELGYTEPEARFLYVVATHSGYIILRQFLNFTGARRGKRSNLFARKVLNNGHGSVRDYLGYGSIHHLFSRTLYGQIEKVNLRNRRKHSFEYIRTRLVLLDFILANPEVEYLETEQDKVTFFCDKLGIAKEFLPGRVYEGGSRSRPTLRYFVDKLPLFIAAALSGHPVVTLSFVDSGFGTIASFLTHLAAYLPLFRHFQAFRFLYISRTDAQFAKAAERFRFVVKQPLESDMSSEVLRYFLVRQRFEKRQYVVPITEDFEFLNEAKSRFHGDRFERLYKAWISATVGEHELRHEFCQTELRRTVFCERYLVTQHRSHLPENERGMVNVA
jgi:hypothetical protein